MSIHKDHSIRGILFMTLHALSVAVIFTSVKYLTQFFESAEIVFFYKLMLLIVSACWVLFNRSNLLVKGEVRWIICRGIISSIASISFMYALKYVDMVNATALGYLEQIIWVILGMMYFQEKPSFIKFFLIAVSFFGALIIIFPKIFNNMYDIIGFQYGISYGTFEWHYLFVMLAVICWGLNAGIIKRLTKNVNVEVQLFYTMIFATVMSFFMAYTKWNQIFVADFSIWLPTQLKSINPAILEFKYFQFLLLTTFCYFLHNIGFYFALKNAPFMTVIPFDYLRLIFTGILSYLVFNKIPEFNAYIGYCLILSSSIILTQLEYKRYKFGR